MRFFEETRFGDKLDELDASATGAELDRVHEVSELPGAAGKD
jgi:hypothetical protein